MIKKTDPRIDRVNAGAVERQFHADIRFIRFSSNRAFSLHLLPPQSSKRIAAERA